MINLKHDNFLFKGFKPSDDLKIYCKEIYCLVEGNAPSEATKIASISKIDNEYEGSFLVTSASAVFKVNLKSKKPKSLINELYKKMSIQILDWAQSRNDK